MLRSFFLVSVIFQCLNFSVSAAGRHLDTEMESSLITSQPQSQSRLPTYDETPGTTRPVNTSEQPDAAFCLLCCGKTYVKPTPELEKLWKDIAQYQKTLSSLENQLKILEGNNPQDRSILTLNNKIDGINREIQSRKPGFNTEIEELYKRQEGTNFAIRWCWNPCAIVIGLSALPFGLEFVPGIWPSLFPTIKWATPLAGVGLTCLTACCKKYSDENDQAYRNQSTICEDQSTICESMKRD